MTDVCAKPDTLKSEWAPALTQVKGMVCAVLSTLDILRAQYDVSRTRAPGIYVAWVFQPLCCFERPIMCALVLHSRNCSPLQNVKFTVLVAPDESVIDEVFVTPEAVTDTV
jgi:hypothetical protein